MASWTEADQFAHALGGHLATITTPEEEEFVRKSLLGLGGGRACWIGARHPTSSVNDVIVATNGR